MSVFVRADLLGKINNLSNFKNEALLPLFEAVVNSIQAIQAEPRLDRGKINVHIRRSGLKKLEDLDSEVSAPIIGFEIRDDGIGFNDVNYESFLTAETTHKIELGCKGVGRFIWLKAFERVEIESTYKFESERRKRKITFDLQDGIKEVSNVSTTEPISTRVKLINFKEEYRSQASAYKTTHKISQRILEHCLYYFISNSAPEITVIDSEESISLDDLFSSIRDNITQEDIKIGKHDFQISHIKLYSTHAQMHKLVLCASNRDVKSIKIGSQLGNTTEFDEEGQKFTYSAYITSDYLNKYVDNIRLDFNFPESGPLLNPDNENISMEQLKNELLKHTKNYLSVFIESIKSKKIELVTSYIANDNPTLRAVPTYCPEIYDEIEPNFSHEKIYEVLFKYKGRAEWEIKKQSEKLLKSNAKDSAEINEECNKLSERLQDFQKDQLATYILFRKMIIDLLEKKLELNTNGKHFNENIVHDIVFPRKSDSHELDYQQHNLWLLDERLTFHTFATSDKPLNEFTTLTSEDRPDVAAFAEVDQDRIARAVSIIEFKKPSKKRFDENPAQQMLRYVRHLKTADITMQNGRTLYVNDQTRFYCYAICEVSKQIREFAEEANYAQLKNEYGYYSYIRSLNTHVEIISFDKIVVDARQRHKAFFEKLGI